MKRHSIYSSQFYRHMRTIHRVACLSLLGGFYFYSTVLLNCKFNDNGVLQTSERKINTLTNLRCMFEAQVFLSAHWKNMYMRLKTSFHPFYINVPKCILSIEGHHYFHRLRLERDKRFSFSRSICEGLELVMVHHGVVALARLEARSRQPCPLDVDSRLSITNCPHFSMRSILCQAR